MPFSATWMDLEIIILSEVVIMYFMYISSAKKMGIDVHKLKNNSPQQTNNNLQNNIYFYFPL